MKRGEIWIVSGTGFASKPRPAIVVQADHFVTDSVTVCLLTSFELDAPLLRLAVPSDDLTGIDKPSFAMVDKITTIRRTNATSHVGELSPVLMSELDTTIATFLGV